MSIKVKYSLCFGLIFVFLGIFLLTGQEKKKYPQSPYWWQVQLTIHSRGQYSHHSGNNSLNGKYSFSTIILGSLEEDDEDFIFVQLTQDINDPQWVETVSNANVQETFDLKNKLRPDATVNYVFRNKGILCFDFDFQPLNVPFHKKLRLPESAGDATVDIKEDYNKGILTGSNQVELEDKDIYNNPINNPTFSWSWQEKKETWSNHHHATVTLKIHRQVKGSYSH